MAVHLLKTFVLLHHLFRLLLEDLLVVDLSPVALVDIVVLFLVVVAAESGVKSSMARFLRRFFEVGLIYH